MFLDRILTQTLADLERRKREQPLEDVQQLAATQAAPRDLLEALKQSPKISLIAEVKRASPSKGLLAPQLDPVELACTYQANGATAISVLTEPHFFLGSPEYLTAIKNAVSIPVLCKDFIVDAYQVYEARAWGADAILLICAILDDAQLRLLLNIAHEQHLHCLVEVHSREEAQRAVAAGAAIIGVNSRDLTTFQMNPSLIRELRPLIPADRVVVAESGIHTTADARRLARYDIQAMLVGESLVISNDVPTQMRSLLRGANASTQAKICGLRTLEHLHAAIEAGTDLLGFIFYEPSPRYIPPQQAQALLSGERNNVIGTPLSERSETVGYLSPRQDSRFIASSRVGWGQRPTEDTRINNTDIVGVFVNKDAAYINEVAEQVGLHIVQLHGDETPEFCHNITRPVIKALHLQDIADLEELRAYREAAWRILLDTPTLQWGGTGVTHDWELARTAAQETRILLAGGLTPQNVADAIQQVQPWGVDVSSGVETNGHKDVKKIQAFIENIRLASSP